MANHKKTEKVLEIWKKIDADKKHAPEDKEADKWLIFHWEEFQKIKGNTLGDVRKNTVKGLNIIPSFLAICHRTDPDGAAKYVNAKYR